MKKKEQFKKEIGITLISLVITIIVLLILAGVTIAILTGDNGILYRTQQAENETKEAGDMEKIRLAVSEAQIGENGYQEINQNNLQEAINSQFEDRDVIVSDNGDATFTVSCLDTLIDYIISGNSIEKGIDWNEAMTNAVAPASQDEARNEGVIGIGTDGKPVDMDLWEYILLDNHTYGLNDINGLDGTGELGRSSGYLGEYTDDGKIIGTVPTYISTDSGKTYTEVTSIVHTFYDCDELIIAPEIPRTVKDMQVAFYEASNLTTSPKNIPNNVENFSYAFYKCENLNTVPILGNNITNMQCSFGYTNIEIFDVTLPKNITNMRRTFEYCSNLKEFKSDIPNGVTNMFATFQYCSNLKDFRSKISDSVTDMIGTFQYCSNLKEFISAIPDSVTDMHATFSSCESLVTGPSKIPNSVKNMFQTFRNCPKLEGTMEINADIDESIVYEYEGRQYTGYQQCFLLSCQDGAGLKIAGTCLKLNELKNNNPNITIYK